MRNNEQFEIVFAKLYELVEVEEGERAESLDATFHDTGITRDEMDEIDVLRQIVLEVNEPMPMSFTTT